ncbi:hypothetical protein PK28_08205 [Hymenobacter sp. DG25B]|nr:hypothetical protein PK28_08205 [Hymenobacter sp. DG25B]
MLVALPSAWAQQASSNPLAEQENLRVLGANGLNNIVMVKNTLYEGVRGTPYFLPAWSTGDILLSTKQRVVNVPLKYDVYSHQIMARRSKGDSIWVDQGRIVEFTLNDDRALPGQPARHLFRLFTNLPNQPNRPEFLEVLHPSGPYVLLKRPVKTLQKASTQQAYSADRPYDEFIDAPEYYLLNPQGTLTLVKPSQKALLAAVPAEWAEPLRAQLKKASLRTEDDLFNAVSQLNLLVSKK